jgi:cleavage and polyadenylation specificity factor subunit 2
LTVNSNVVYIDFEGRSEAKSIKNIISQVAPRKLILVHGSSKDTDHLAHHCYEHQSLTNDIYAPSIGQCLDVSSATNLFKITLTDPLVTSLNIAKFGDYELSYISGVVKREKIPTVPDENDENVEDLENAEDKLVLDVAPSESIRFHKPVMIGDLKLSEFRTLLLSRGFSAEFVSGALIVNGRVIVRKDGRNLKLEGGINADYFSVRRLLYEFHAII